MDLLKQLKEKMTGDVEDFGNSDFGSKLLLGKEFNSLTENLTEPLMWQQEDINVWNFEDDDIWGVYGAMKD